MTEMLKESIGGAMLPTQWSDDLEKKIEMSKYMMSAL